MKFTEKKYNIKERSKMCAQIIIGVLNTYDTTYSVLAFEMYV